MDKVVPNPPLG